MNNDIKKRNKPSHEEVKSYITEYFNNNQSAIFDEVENKFKLNNEVLDNLTKTLDELYTKYTNSASSIDELLRKFSKLSVLTEVKDDVDFTINDETFVILLKEGTKNNYVYLPPVDSSFGRRISIKRAYSVNTFNHIVRPLPGDKLENVTDGFYTLNIEDEAIELICCNDGWLLITSYGN